MDGDTSMRPPHLDSKAKGTYRDDHGTPSAILDAVRNIAGPIDLDLASNASANELVQAAHYYTADDPCPDAPDMAGKTVWCNPPGPGVLVHRFWAIWQGCERGAFLFFNVDHMRRCGPPKAPCVVILLNSRLKYVGSKHQCSWPTALVLPHMGDLERTLEMCRELGLGHCYTWAPVV